MVSWRRSSEAQPEGRPRERDEIGADARVAEDAHRLVVQVDAAREVVHLDALLEDDATDAVAGQ